MVPCKKQKPYSPIQTNPKRKNTNWVHKNIWGFKKAGFKKFKRYEDRGSGK